MNEITVTNELEIRVERVFDASRALDENRVGLGKCDERGHRRRAGSNDVVAVIACHDHQLKITVVAVGACDPVRVHDLDATRFLARSRHVPSVKTSACRQLWQRRIEPLWSPVAQVDALGERFRTWRTLAATYLYRSLTA